MDKPVDPTAPADKSHHLDKRSPQLLEEPGSDDDLLTTLMLAAWLGISKQSLEGWRSKGLGPRFVALTPSMIRYRRGDVRAWLRERSHYCTAEYERRAGFVPAPNARVSEP